jgi:2-hydroxy-3-keto-5-methylthiopentenyl-1-phosphate phosphatase
LEVYFPSFLHLDIFIFISQIYEIWYVCEDSIADIGLQFVFCYFQERDIPVLIFSAGLADIIEEVWKVNFVLRILSISLYFLGC